MEEIYDQFPINILEMGGRIERKPIDFIVYSFSIWEDGLCFLRGKKDAIIKGRIVSDEMSLKLKNIDLEWFIDNDLVFSEISLNKDRILWSNGLLNGGYSSRDNIPAFMSLFYQMGDLQKIQFSNQRYLIEFCGTTMRK